ncbi:hypothetical protein [uncultured Tenacibaculum sp.]|uniref:hypothetical protein n=1 Tax=uncultured Tenacibaculum sp. TaxID=174713 RepID=UPI002638CEDF|nr:hypothetical protein [uncultured Tenacibaculum sp.]
MVKTIVTTQDLIDYLKVPDFDSKEKPEVAIKKITREAIYEDEFMELSVFQRLYKEVSVPRVLYIDTNNKIYKRYRFSEDVIYYKPITYVKNDIVLKDDNFSEPIVELVIPEEIYNGGYDFYIDQDDRIVASVEVTTISNTKNYIAFSPDSFSYLKQYPKLSYKYENVYGATAAQEILVSSYQKKGLVHRFPIITKTFLTGGYNFRLSYYYKKDSREVRTIPPAQEDEQFIAVSLFFKDIATVLSFLNKTIFNYYNEYNDYRSSWRNRFLTELTYQTMNVLSNGGSVDKKPSIIFHLPQPMYYIFKSTQSLWSMLVDLSKGYIRNNLSINEEDLILKLLRIIYHRSTNKRKSVKVNDKERFEEVDNESIGKNNAFIENLLTRKVGGKLLLYKLITGLDGNQFKEYISFIWNIWKNSSYSVVDPEQNKKVVITSQSPVFVDYRSNKTLGFYTDNAEINWEGKEPKIDIAVKVKTGKKVERETINIGEVKSRFISVPKESEYEVSQYTYHPFSPIILEDSENPKFLLQDKEDTDVSKTKLPAFVLFANKETAFWENVITGGEYLIDVITTVSGIGNIIKAGRLINVLKGGKALLLKTTVQSTKAITAVKATAGTIEVTSGVVNTLLKLTGAEDTELGKTVAKYLFYLEMAALAGEISVALGRKLKNTATELVENPNFEKSLDDLFNKAELDELAKNKFIDELEINSTLNAKIEDYFKIVKKNKTPIRLIFIDDIVTNLNGVTNQSTKITQAIKKGRIQKKVLDDDLFNFYYLHFGGDPKYYASAMEFESIMYFREITPVDKFFNEIVHEGTHALDRYNGIIDDYDELYKITKDLIYKENKIENYIKDLNLEELVEFRARFFEREFQIVTNQKPDYNNLEEMIKFIKKNYNKKNEN